METREELETMPLELLRGRDIRTKEEEDLVQEVLNERLVVEMPDFQPDIPFRQGTTTDIKDKAEEEALQAKIDAQREAHRKLYESRVEEVPSDTPIEEAPIEPTPIVEPLPDPTVVRFCEFCDSKGGRHKKDCTRQT